MVFSYEVILDKIGNLVTAVCFINFHETSKFSHNNEYNWWGADVIIERNYVVTIFYGTSMPYTIQFKEIFL